MAEYLLVYEGGDPEWTKKPPDRIRGVMEQWGAWKDSCTTSSARARFRGPTRAEDACEDRDEAAGLAAEQRFDLGRRVQGITVRGHSLLDSLRRAPRTRRLRVPGR
jgi:hypothetical protein